MKKIFRVMAVLATVSAVTAVSCAKPEMEYSVAGSDEEIYDGPVKELVFDAFVGEAQTRTALDTPVTGEDGKTTIPVLWESGDKVDLYWMDGETSQKRTGEIVVDEETKAAVLTVKVPEELSTDTKFYAVYPSGTAASLSPENGEIEVTIPTETGTFKKANIMVARCSNFVESAALAFKHACSIIRFETGDHAFYEGKQVSRISLYHGEQAFVRGKVSFDFADDNTINVNTKTGAGDRYVSARNVNPNAECFVAVFPDYEFDKGFVASYFYQQLSAYTEAPFSVARGEILSLGNIQSRLDKHRNFYFKPDGTGDASSWENAGNIAKFREILTEKTPNSLGYMQRLKLDNTNYHFMEGTYQLAEGGEGSKRFFLECTKTSRGDAMPVNIYGGYSEDNPSVRDAKQYETIFTGNSQYAILAVRDRVILSIDGITFKDAVADNAVISGEYVYGAALHVNRKNDDDFAAPVVHVRNCKFVNNKQTGTKINNNYDGGAAINLGCGKVYVDGCEFTNNYSGAERGGAIMVSNYPNGNNDNVLFLNNCVFTENGTKKGFGKMVWCATPECKFAMNNCTVYNTNTDGNGVLTLCSPYVLTNNTIVDTSGDQIVRMVINATYTGSEAAYANNIIIDQSSANVAMWLSQTTNCTYTMTSGGHNYLSKALTTTSVAGFTFNHTTSTTDVENITTNNFGEWQYDSAGGYYTWNGTYPSGEVSYKATDLVAATKANSKIGNAFHDWLVKIGAIVNGQFTDCRGYLRPTDGMCPGAYDPNAVSSASQPE